MASQTPNRVRDQADPDSRDERWWENCTQLSDSFDFEAAQLDPPENGEGVIWEVLEQGVAAAVDRRFLRMMRAFVELPERQRSVYALRMAKRMSFRQIAEELGITHPTAKKLYDDACMHFQRFSTGKGTKRPSDGEYR